MDPKEPGSPDSRGSRMKKVPAWATELARLMDEAVAIPGTEVRVGLDAILGFLLPGVGDALAAASGIVLIVLSFSVGVPKIVIVRLVLNVLVDAAIGSIPILGDVFDVGFKSNRRNVELIERFQRPGATAKPSDYLFVIGCVLTVMLVLLLPLLAAGWVIAKLVQGAR